MAKFDADKWLAISAMVVSIGTLAALSYQALLMRDAERASKLPYLYISMLSNDQTGNILQLTNSGIGPALIEEVHVEYKGRTFPTDAYDFILIQKPDFANSGLGVDKIQKGRLIPAGATVQMVEAGRGPASLPGMLRLFEIAEVPRQWYKSLGVAGGDKAVLVITYTSVYGERWRVRSDRIVPDRL
jgi:hypothetical protein